MAFPQIVSTNTSTQGPPNASTHNVSLPATINSGNLIIIHAGINGTPTITGPSGFTELVSSVNSGTLKVWGKVADGTEGGTTVTFTTNVNEQSAHCTYSISGWSGNLAEVESQTSSGFGNMPPPPSISPSWGAEDTTFIAGTSLGVGNLTVSAYPTNYTSNQLSSMTGAITAGAGAATATRENNTATETPSAYTISGNSNYNAFTIAIRPASGSPGVTASVTESLTSFTEDSTVNIDYNVSINVTETLNSFAESSIVNISTPLIVEVDVTETLNSFEESSVINIKTIQKVEADVTETLSSFTEQINATIAVKIEVTEVLNSFGENSSVKLPTNWVVKPPVSSDWDIKAETSTNWTIKG